MVCPNCQSSKVVKNGRIKVNRAICVECNRQFSENPLPQSYSAEVKALCQTIHNGIGFRGIERAENQP